MENKNIRVVFFGTSDFSKVILTSLLETSYNVVGVFTRTDKKVGRRQEWQKTPVKILAEKNNIPIFTPEKLDDTVSKEISALSPDIIITASYGKIIPKVILDIPKFGALNVHPSLLPKFRGPSPIQNTLLAGEKETGTTIMLMDAGMDTGDILSQKKVIVEQDENFPELLERLTKISADLLLETIPLWTERKIKPEKQNHSEATLCQMIKKEDGKINWQETAQIIYNKYRALYPWPGVFTVWNGKRIKLNKLRLIEKELVEKQPAGKVFLFDKNIAVSTGKEIIILEELQLEGKSSVKAIDFINGYKNFIGSIL